MAEEKCFCGLSLNTHLKCAGCSILAGQKHDNEFLFEFLGKKFCEACFIRRQKKIPPGGYDPRYFTPGPLIN